MKKKDIAVTERMLPEEDYIVLAEYVKRLGNSIEQNNIGLLAEALPQIKKIAAESMPQDLIRLGTLVTIRDNEKDKLFNFTVVEPASANLKEGRIPFTVPLGAALIGRSLGQEIDVTLPGGRKIFHIEKVLNN